MKFWLNNEETTFNICRSMRQSGEIQSVSVVSYKQKMKKDNDLKSEKRELMVGDLVLLTVLGCVGFRASSSPNILALT